MEVVLSLESLTGIAVGGVIGFIFIRTLVNHLDRILDPRTCVKESKKEINDFDRPDLLDEILKLTESCQWSLEHTEKGDAIFRIRTSWIDINQRFRELKQEYSGMTKYHFEDPYDYWIKFIIPGVNINRGYDFKDEKDEGIIRELKQISDNLREEASRRQTKAQPKKGQKMNHKANNPSLIEALIVLALVLHLEKDFLLRLYVQNKKIFLMVLGSLLVGKNKLYDLIFSIIGQK
jgi:hypothetical protein